MASVVIQGDTSGSVTLQAPAVAGSTTVNLPSTIGNAGTSAVVTTDASGNAGIGVTPSAWGSGRLAFQIAGSSANYFMGANANSLVFGSNFFSDGTNNKYIANGFASAYIQASSHHLWYTAASGTAGNAITFTQAMTLDASGNLGVGTTSPSGKIHAVGNTPLFMNNAAATSEAKFDFIDSGATLRLHNFYGTGSNITFLTNPNGGSVTERARITSAGEFWVAGTTDQGAYNIQCNGTGVWGAGAYVNGSDARIKEEIQPIDSGLDVVQKLNPVTYKYKEDWTKDRSTQTGFIAQELLVALEGKNYVDGVVTQGGSEGYYSVAYQNIIPILTKAIQELNAKVEAQAAEIAALKAAGSN